MSKLSCKNKEGLVLILVLMEDALRGATPVAEEQPTKVLILVLMEDALRAKHYWVGLTQE